MNGPKADAFRECGWRIWKRPAAHTARNLRANNVKIRQFCGSTGAEYVVNLTISVISCCLASCREACRRAESARFGVHPAECVLAHDVHSIVRRADGFVEEDVPWTFSSA
jgi:hypothetical protein